MLALCEDLPMSGIGIYFFVRKYQVPAFQVIHLAAYLLRSSGFVAFGLALQFNLFYANCRLSVS